MALPTKTDLTIDDIIESLTGFEELEITNRFGADVTTLLEEKPTFGVRSLAFVVAARDANDGNGTPDALANGKAYNHVMGLSLKQVNEFFPDDEVEPVLDGDEPVTPAGKPDEPVS